MQIPELRARHRSVADLENQAKGLLFRTAKGSKKGLENLTPARPALVGWSSEQAG